MSRLALYLTLPGFGAPRAPAPPPPPPAPPPAPTMQDAEGSRARTDAVRRSRLQQGMAGTVRNRGGAQGLLAVSDTERALKSLTGQ
jgi:hypothetical protein